ncbi:MAG: tRNA glutamyl-Q(34) synthetase GluQRS [Lysobacteraceae bacterium]
MTTGVRGRFAPSPTGPLHFGSLTAALGSWLFTRHRGGEWLLRVEDIDPPREVAGAAHSQIQTLAAFGLRPDRPVFWQSTRNAVYARAIDVLLQSGRAFECRCSRSDLAANAGVHSECVASNPQRAPAIRLRVPDQRVAFDDLVQGHFEQSTRDAIGDFVLRRADGLWAYQLAVVVDDAMQGITQVVRGADLLDSTPRQILLQRALGLATPDYAHLPLAVDTHRRKLAKSSDAPAIDPADPLPPLRAALAFLGQPTHASNSARDPEMLLAQALDQFDPSAIPRVLQRVAAIPDGEGRISTTQQLE